MLTSPLAPDGYYKALFPLNPKAFILNPKPYIRPSFAAPFSTAEQKKSRVRGSLCVGPHRENPNLLLAWGLQGLRHKKLLLRCLKVFEKKAPKNGGF